MGKKKLAYQEVNYAEKWRVIMKRLYFTKLILVFFLFACDENRQENRNFEVAIEKIKKENLDQISRPKENLPYLAHKNLDSVWEEENPDIIKIPSFSLQNQAGQKVGQEKLKGKITISCFFYTKCSGICPRVMQNMKRIKAEFENDREIYFLSFSVTPDIDTAEVLKKYIQFTGFGKVNWDLVTGDKTEIYKLARNTFYADTNTGETKSKDDFIHSEQLYLIDSNLKLRAIYNGNINGDIERIIKDIRKLKKLG